MSVPLPLVLTSSKSSRASKARLAPGSLSAYYCQVGQIIQEKMKSSLCIQPFKPQTQSELLGCLLLGLSRFAMPGSFVLFFPQPGMQFPWLFRWLAATPYLGSTVCCPHQKGSADENVQKHPTAGMPLPITTRAPLPSPSLGDYWAAVFLLMNCQP